MKTYTEGLYEGLKLALKIVKLFNTKEDIIEHIKSHLIILDSHKYIDEREKI